MTPRSAALDLDRYDTDKIASYYLPHYDAVVGDRALEVRSVLEMGVKDGASLRLWADYFPNAVVAGLDLEPPANFAHPRVRLFEGAQQDTGVLDRLAAEVAPEGFDVVIDDAAHVGRIAAACFWHVFPRHVRPGGVYCIEDWGTGYWSDWPDGAAAEPPRAGQGEIDGDARRMPSHDYGMVGFLKTLVDEQGVWDLTRRSREGAGVSRPSAFERLVIAAGVAFVIKKG